MIFIEKEKYLFVVVDVTLMVVFDSSSLDVIRMT
jgi:hypothetical protein